MSQCIYIFAFLALLRSDEALNLNRTSIEYRDEHLTLTLDHRKNAQDGNVMPFILYRNDKEEFLCPVRAYLRWLAVRGPDLGPLFMGDTQGRLNVNRLSYVSFKYRFD